MQRRVYGPSAPPLSVATAGNGGFLHLLFLGPSPVSTCLWISGKCVLGWTGGLGRPCAVLQEVGRRGTVRFSNVQGCGK